MLPSALLSPVALTAVIHSLDPYVDFTTGAVVSETTVSGFAVDDVPHQANRAVVVHRAGFATEADLIDLQARAMAAGASAIIIKDPERRSLTDRHARGRTRMPTIVVLERVPWASILTRLQGLSDQTVHNAEPVNEHVLVTLVEAADRLGEALGGSVIVEDNNFQLLAHSRASNELDEARRVAILERRLPDLYQRAFNAQGIIAKLVSGQDVVEASPVPNIGLGPRLVAAIRHEGDLLGSVWFARDARPFTAEDATAMATASSQLGGMLRQILLARRDQREYLQNSVKALLRGDRVEQSAELLARTVAIAADAPLHVLHLWTPAGPGGTAVPLSTLRTVAESVGQATRDMVFAVQEEHTVKVALIGCPVTPERCTEAHPLRYAERVLGELGQLAERVWVGVGGHRVSLAKAVESSEEAGRARTALLRGSGGQAASLRQVWASVAVQSCLPLLDGALAEWSTPLLRVMKHDEERQTDYERSLLVALERWGDIRSAADQLHVHANTLRYRLGRIAEVADIDLTDPTQRLVLQLQLLRRQEQRRRAELGVT